MRSCCCRFFDEISQDTGKFVFGVGDTLQCLEMGAVETLIVWENLEVSTPASSTVTSRSFSALSACELTMRYAACLASSVRGSGLSFASISQWPVVALSHSAIVR